MKTIITLIATLNRFNIVALSLIGLVLTGARWPSLTSSYAIHCIIGRPVGQGGCTGQTALKDWRYQIRDAKDYWNSVGNFTIRWVHESVPNNCSCTNLNINDNINVITAETSYNPKRHGMQRQMSYRMVMATFWTLTSHFLQATYP